MKFSPTKRLALPEGSEMQTSGIENDVLAMDVLESLTGTKRTGEALRTRLYAVVLTLYRGDTRMRLLRCIDDMKSDAGCFAFVRGICEAHCADFRARTVSE